MALTRDQIINALRRVREPDVTKDIVTLNMLKEIRVDDEHVYVRVELPLPSPAVKDSLHRDIEKALHEIGAERVTIDLTNNPKGTAQSPAAGGRAKDVLPQVKNVVAVGAGKGGVGKSTISVNLAVGLHRAGFKVGLMDGDIYGPSAPTLLGIKGQPALIEASKITPFHVHGIHAVTIGALVPEDKPLIWRGPMAHGAFKQLLLDNTVWPELDYLIVDLPPGTGDVPLTLCQLLPLTGAIIVATPQQVALDDALRAVRMFQQLETTILGLVENMSYLVGPNGMTVDIFGRGGAELAAKKMQLPFLGALPLFPELRVNSDAGDPHKNFQGTPELREALAHIVEELIAQVEQRNAQSSGPELTVV